jgi:hypothetical protein
MSLVILSTAQVWHRPTSQSLDQILASAVAPTPAGIGLGNVDNTSDINKPVSTAQAAAIALKANLNSPTFTGTVAGITSTMIGLGNVTNTSDANKPVSTAQATAISTAVSTLSATLKPVATSGASSDVAVTATGGSVLTANTNVQAAFASVESHLVPSFAAASIPLTNVGDIYVPDASPYFGRMKFYLGRYAANNLPTKYRPNSGGHTEWVSVTQIKVNAASWRSNADNCDIYLSSVITKTVQTSGAWTAGTGNNGLFTGARTASSGYHIFVIRNDATSVTDIGFDTNPVASNRPTGYTEWRRVGFFRTDVSNNIYPYLQRGPLTEYLLGISNYGLASIPANTNEIANVSSPTGVRCLVHGTALVTAMGQGSGFSIFGGDSVSSGALAGGDYPILGIGAGYSVASTFIALSNTVAQVSLRCTQALDGSTTGFYLVSRGYTDFLED